MSKKLRVAIVGCGGIANAKHMPSLSKLSAVEMVAFCDNSEDRALEAAHKYGSGDKKVYRDYREMLQDGSIDVVHVCSSNDSHAEITIASLEAGKHVMCEKPMAKTAVDARRMAAAAKRTGKKLTIGYNSRFRPECQALYQICRRGDLGDIYFAKAQAIRRRAVPTWGVFLNEEKQGGGPLIDIGTHAIDLTLWMMDNFKPKVVLGKAFHKLSNRENAANAFGPWDPKKFTVEDSAFGMITMENGATIIVESSWALNTLETVENLCTLCGTEGGADMKDGLRINGEQSGRLYTTKMDLEIGGVAFYESKQESPQEREMRCWIEAISNDKDPVVTPEQALVVSEIVEASYESSKTGRAIYFS